MHKKWVALALLGVFLYWVLPEAFSNRVTPQADTGRFAVQSYFLTWKFKDVTYSRGQVESIAVRYQKAYFDLKMRGIYRVGLKFRDGTWILLKTMSTTHQYEMSLAYAPDLEIKHRQALEAARQIAAQLNLPVQDETGSLLTR